MSARQARTRIHAHYRYPHVSDRRLDFVVLTATAAVAVVSVVFVSSPWRYPTPGDYVAAVEASARKLVEDRLLLDKDARRIVERAAQAM